MFVTAPFRASLHCWVGLCLWTVLNQASGQTLDELKTTGALRSAYRSANSTNPDRSPPQARLRQFRSEIAPALKNSCVHCHGPDVQEGNIRIDTLNPDLLHGDDIAWWLEVLAVLTKGEMPPADEPNLPDVDRSRIVQWLSSELQAASIVRRTEQGHTTFRRMTRYEYNYALQDLLKLPIDFTRDLPPEATSEDGFQNSSETLHMSVSQLETYRAVARTALRRAIVTTDQPSLKFWGVPMSDAAKEAWTRQDEERQKLKEKHKDDPEKQQQELERFDQRAAQPHRSTYYKNLTTGRTERAQWRYYGAKYAWTPSADQPEFPDSFDHVAIIPPRQKLIVELGDSVPDSGILRVRVRASRGTNSDSVPAGLQLEFGWQASNDSHASVRVSKDDIVVTASPDQPQIYQWDIHLSDIYPRNSVRGIAKMGDLPSPSEYIKFVNSSLSTGDIQIDFVEVTAPVYESWPPASHNNIFIESSHRDNEQNDAREVISRFMTRAWRRPVSESEIDQKMKLFNAIRNRCDSFEDAVIEVLSTVLSSPRFLYLARQSGPVVAQHELATRISVFLWSSLPDDELRQLAVNGRLAETEVLTAQVDRMLADSRSKRLPRHFVRQWLGLQLLDYLKVDRKVHPQFDSRLKSAMQREPIEFFTELLTHNRSVLDFLHSEDAVINERLSHHYGISGVYGTHFRRVKLNPEHSRGGLLTQAGLLAMNSDGTDSHPLKRGIWLLEKLLNDPPPPPPPAVPEIDVADPAIAKMTLKERLENHRNQAACMSCHAKIDPWGIAFENYDAVGSWRSKINDSPVDASSVLFNNEPLEGMIGLKRYLLKERQDQFVRALVFKLTTYALGRPLTFADHASIDSITAEMRRQGDGLATLVKLIVTSDLFRGSSADEAD